MLCINDILQIFRLSVGVHETGIKRFTDKEWNEILIFAKEQGVIGVMFEGVRILQEELNNSIPQNTLLKWIGLVLQIKNRNLQLNLRCVEISKEFDKAGFRTCILKGQGNALMYPDPTIRQPGDIDIWVDSGRSDIINYVKNKFKDAEECEHHIDYPRYDDVSVEVHFMPRFLYNKSHNKAFMSFVEKKRNLQFCNKIAVNSEGDICIPTFEFNVVYQLVHMLGHFIENGIGLRQVTDFIYLLKQKDEVVNDFSIILDELGMSVFAQGIMWIGNELFGLEIKDMIIQPNEKAGKIILSDILETGNLGKHGLFLQSRGKLAYSKRVIFYLQRQKRICYVTQSETIYFLLIMFKKKIRRFWPWKY